MCCLLICHFKEAAARGAGIQGEIGGGGGNKYVASSGGGNACRESPSVVMNARRAVTAMNARRGWRRWRKRMWDEAIVYVGPVAVVALDTI